MREAADPQHCRRPLAERPGDRTQAGVSHRQRVPLAAAFHRAVELVRNGRIGQLHTIRTAVPAGVGPVNHHLRTQTCRFLRNSITNCGRGRPQSGPIRKNGCIASRATSGRAG